VHLQYHDLYKLLQRHPADGSSLDDFDNDPGAHSDHNGSEWLPFPKSTMWGTSKGKVNQWGLVRLCGHEAMPEPDSLTKLFRWDFFKWFHRLFHRYSEPEEDYGGYSYSWRSVEEVAFHIAIVVTSWLPAGVDLCPVL
jgi:hypothetical protein